MCIQFPTEKEEYGRLFINNARYVGATFQILSDLPSLRTKEAMERELILIKRFNREVCRALVVQKQGKEAAPGLIAAQYIGHKPISAAKNFNYFCSNMSF